MTSLKIGIHDGIFHADELFAIALVELVWSGTRVEVIRTRDAAKLAECDQRIDVGGKYDPSTGDYDHHQDKNLPSSFGLIYAQVKNHLDLDEYSEPFFAEFVRGIDIMDTNPTSVQFPDAPVRNLNQIIGGFNSFQNQDTAFDRALVFAGQILENELRSAREKGQAAREYQDRGITENNVAVFNNFSPIWKEKGDHDFAVMPHPSGWQIVARDTRVVTVPEAVSNVEGFIFRHKNGFMATFATKEAALEAAKLV